MVEYLQQRRTPLMSIQEIFELIEKKGPQSMKAVYSKLGFSWEQLDSYLKIIHFIQKQPKLNDKKLGARTRILFLDTRQE